MAVGMGASLESPFEVYLLFILRAPRSPSYIPLFFPLLFHAHLPISNLLWLPVLHGRKNVHMPWVKKIDVVMGSGRLQEV